MDEFGLIARYFSAIGPRPTGLLLDGGDDAAVLSCQGLDWAWSTDTLLEGRHFDERFSPADIGWRSLAVNLSDLVAMGATPHSALLALTVPHADPDWLAGFAEGLNACAHRYGVGVVGGNTSRGPCSITLSVLGTLPTGQRLTRSGAQIGDLLCVSGLLGGAAAALAGEALFLPALLRPEPQVSLGQRLLGQASAAMDLSDGLAGDLPHLLAASGVGAVIETWPIHPDLPVELAFASDDYHLLFTWPSSHPLPPNCVAFGRIVAETGIHGPWPKMSGYQHF